MNHPQLTIWRILARKLAVLLLIIGSGAGAFATLGDGKKSEGPKNSLLNVKINTHPGTFSLRSGYAYRGNQVFNSTEKKYIRLNTVVTMQKGNTTYIVPLKKKVVLENVKIEIGNRQFRRN